MTYGQFVAIIEANGFGFRREGRGSHCQYRGTVAGVVQVVTVAAHRMRDDVPKGTLDAMIRQSGLNKALFR